MIDKLQAVSFRAILSGQSRPRLTDEDSYTRTTQEKLPLNWTCAKRRTPVPTGKDENDVRRGRLEAKLGNPAVYDDSFGLLKGVSTDSRTIPTISTNFAVGEHVLQLN